MYGPPAFALGGWLPPGGWLSPILVTKMSKPLLYALSKAPGVVGKSAEAVKPVT